ncbi:MAG: PAM68 family protein [Cyanobacteriota bacterium]|nr:PAM68 family protein [Cyanobacteriota bacterium]
MAEQRNPLPFEPKGSGKAVKPASGAPRQEAIPRYVADRMARRVAIFTGLPTVAGMGVFVGSYLLITNGIAEIAPGLTLAASGGFFLLGLVGLSFGVLSASWDSQPGSILGVENLRPNLKRMRESIRASKQQKTTN